MAFVDTTWQQKENRSNVSVRPENHTLEVVCPTYLLIAKLKNSVTIAVEPFSVIALFVA